MAKGLPKSIIAKYGISKKAWQIYRGAKSRVSKAIRTKRKAYKPKTRNKYAVRHMARKRRRSARSFLSFSTIMKFIKIGAIAAPALARYSELSGTPLQKVGWTLGSMGGVLPNGNFDFGLLARMWTPYIATSLVSVGIQKMNGIIRRL